MEEALVRRLLAALVVLTFTCLATANLACSSQDHELTAQEILDRQSNDIKSARLVSVREATVEGDALHDEMEGLIAENGMFLKRGNTQVLLYMEDVFVRMADTAGWTEASPKFLLVEFQNFRFTGLTNEEPDTIPTPRSASLTRLPNEDIEGRATFVIRGIADYTDEDPNFAEDTLGLLQTASIPEVRSVDPSHIVRLEAQMDAWLDVETFCPGARCVPLHR
jgi:hypothetical protein